MATLPPIPVPQGIVTNINAAAQITDGLPMIVQNIQGGTAWLIESATEPDLKYGAYGWKLPHNAAKINEAGADTVWAYSRSGSLLQVEEA